MSDEYDVELTEEHIMLRDMVRKFADKEIAPVADQDEKRSPFPKRARKSDGRTGPIRLPCPGGIWWQQHGISGSCYSY